MTKEEYLKKHTALKEKLYQLDIDYIKSNSPIPKGTKVKITSVNYDGDTKVSYGFIESYFIGYEGRRNTFKQTFVCSTQINH